MPIYEYICKSCNLEFDKFITKNTNKEIVCPKCFSKDIKKKISQILNTNKSNCGTCRHNCSNCGGN